MSTPPPDDAPKPEPPPAAAKPAPPPEPKTRWTRYKLPVNRKDRAARSAPLPPSGTPPKSNAVRNLLIVVGIVVVLPIVGCLFLFALCAAGLR